MSGADVARCLRLLEARGQTLSTAESLTAGQVSATIADVPGSSAVLRGGLAAYASDVKVSVLGVDAAVVQLHGVISRECAEAMALAACRLFETDWALSTTGVAGPTEQDGRRVGTVYVAVCSSAHVVSRELHLSGDRAEIRSAATDAALTLLTEQLCSSSG